MQQSQKSSILPPGTRGVGRVQGLRHCVCSSTAATFQGLCHQYPGGRDRRGVGGFGGFLEQGNISSTAAKALQELRHLCLRKAVPARPPPCNHARRARSACKSCNLGMLEGLLISTLVGPPKYF